MKAKQTIKKFSLLGFILIAASAITSAMQRSSAKAEINRADEFFSLTESAGILVCRPTEKISDTCSCDQTL